MNKLDKQRKQFIGNEKKNIKIKNSKQKFKITFKSKMIFVDVSKLKKKS